MFQSLKSLTTDLTRSWVLNAVFNPALATKPRIRTELTANVLQVSCRLLLWPIRFLLSVNPR
jgi:hypothetical protein